MLKENKDLEVDGGSWGIYIEQSGNNELGCSLRIKDWRKIKNLEDLAAESLRRNGFSLHGTDPYNFTIRRIDGGSFYSDDSFQKLYDLLHQSLDRFL
jgi:hypothetical protein